MAAMKLAYLGLAVALSSVSIASASTNNGIELEFESISSIRYFNTQLANGFGPNGLEGDGGKLPYLNLSADIVGMLKAGKITAAVGDTLPDGSASQTLTPGNVRLVLLSNNYCISVAEKAMASGFIFKVKVTGDYSTSKFEGADRLSVYPESLYGAECEMIRKPAR